MIVLKGLTDENKKYLEKVVSESAISIYDASLAISRSISGDAPTPIVIQAIMLDDIMKKLGELKNADRN